MIPDDIADSFIRVVGENARRAREWAGFSRLEVMQRVFNYQDSKSTNRICEIENGYRAVSISTLYKLCLFYQCSADFLLGISNEIEPNIAASHNCLIVESMRIAGLEMADKISLSLTKQSEYLPRFEGLLLANSSKQTYQLISKYLDEPTFIRNYPDIVSAAKEMNENIMQFEITLAKYLRYLEMSAIQAIEACEHTYYPKPTIQSSYK